MTRAGLPGSPRPVDVVYVHAPFCARRCVYCDFAVDVSRAPPLAPWLDALTGELGALEREGEATLADRLETLYVGGGTPSLLGPGAMEGLAEVLGRRRTAEVDEWTAEANPESLTSEVAVAWRRAGVNRLSLGTQTFDERALRWMGRLHGPSGTEAAVAAAREAGIENLSVDLIFGLPPELERDLDRDLDRVVRLDVPHVSLYGLTAEPATRLGRDVREGRTAMPDDERYADEYLRSVERLEREGYEAYEVSNFARPGYRSRHNTHYWTGRAYLGLGNSAHGYLPPERRWNLRDWDAYASSVAAGQLPVAERETVAGSAERLERVWLGLRTDRGIPESTLRTAAARERVLDWRREGLARPEGESGRVVLTPHGWLLLDRLAVELDDALERTTSSLP